MSTRYVRDTMRAAMRDLWGDAYNEITNARAMPQPLPDVPWVSLEFYAFSNTMVSLGNPGCWRESGDMRVTFWTQAGTTDAVALSMADELLQNFRRWHDTTGTLRISDMAAPVEVGSPDAEGLFYGLAVTLSYDFDYSA